MDKQLICNAIAIKEVAEELGLDINLVKAIVSSQSEYTVMVMESDTFDSIRWPHFGIFQSKPKEVQMINHLRGMTLDQQKDFKRAVRTKQIILNGWEKKTK